MNCTPGRGDNRKYGLKQAVASPFRPLLTRVVVQTLALYLTFRPLPLRMAFRIRSGLNGPPDQKNEEGLAEES